MQKNDVTIIGGGLAGLTAAIHLSKIGIKVTIIEKNSYPKHKVCGEYISNEVLNYLKFLDLDIESLNPTKISKLHFSTQSGKSIQVALPLGGFGISRFVLDEYLYKKAIANGCIFIQTNVSNVDYQADEFEIKTENKLVLKSKIVIGAFGKRGTLDQKMNRNFIKKKSNWLAVKAHYSGNFDNDLVGLHNFDGGYCGISKVENNKINICYLANYKNFKKHKNIDDFQKLIVLENPFLKNFFENSKILFDKPLSISQISFDQKKTVENHILMIGDSAGLIHPLCGNGMAMAIHSAKIVTENIKKSLENQIFDRKKLEQNYIQEWNKNFKNRLKMGRILSKVLLKPNLADVLIDLLVIFPAMLTLIIKKTHGKPF